MTDTVRYALFDGDALGPDLALEGGGRTVYCAADSLNINRMVLGDIDVSLGIHFGEMFFGGDDALTAVIGIHLETATLNQYPGASADGIGWRLHTGEIVINGVVVQSGLPIIGKYEAVGILVDMALGEVTFKRGKTEVHTRSIGAGPWFFAVAMACTNANGLWCFLNAGQSSQFGQEGVDGWRASLAYPAPLRLSTQPLQSAVDDSPPNARWEGVIAEQGLQIVRELSFQVWGDSRSSVTVGRLTLLDGDDKLRTLVEDDWRGAQVIVRILDVPDLPANEPFSFYGDEGGDAYVDEDGNLYEAV